MKQTTLLSFVLLLLSVTILGQVPPSRTTNPIKSISGANWTKTSSLGFILKDKSGNTISNIMDLLYLSTDTLSVLDKGTRSIYLLADIKNATIGTAGKAQLLTGYVGKDFFITNKHSFGTYINDEYYKGVYSNIDGSYIFYVDELDATYYFDGVRNFNNWGAKSIHKLDYTSNHTYWYRDVDKASYGVIIKGKVLNYDEASTVKDGNDLIVSINNIKTYVLPGYYTMASFIMKPVKMYTDSSTTDEIGCKSGDCVNGWGKYQYDNGYYEGFWKNSYKHDYGMYSWTDSGGKYIGNWKDDNMNGYGVYIAESNDNIIGDYKDGKLNGLGLTVYGEEWSYGIFTDGSLTSKYDFFTNSNVELGCVAGDCQNKYGRWKWNNGDSFTGFFENGKLLMGTYNFSNGDRYTGMFNSSNRFHGVGRYFYKDGSYYGGEWSQGNMEGRGYYHNKDLVQQIGVWSNNTLTKSLNN